MSRGGVRQTRSVWVCLVGVAGAIVGAVLGVLPGAYLGWEATLLNDGGPSSLHNGWDLTGCISKRLVAFAGSALVGTVGPIAGGWAGWVAGERLAGGRRQQAGTGGGEVIDLAPAPPPG